MSAAPATVTADREWSAVVSRLLDLSPVRRLADAAAVHPSTVYRWAAGSPPMISVARQMLLNGDEPVRAALLAYLLGGTGIIATAIADPEELDQNGDGVADAEDALRSVIDGMRHAAASLELINLARADDAINAAELCAIDAAVGAAIRTLVMARDALHEQSQREAKRRSRFVKLDRRSTP